MIVIEKDGKVVSRSRNQRGLRAYCGKHAAASVHISRHGDGTGELRVTFSNGAGCTVPYASYRILCDFLSRWRNLYGAPLYVNGTPASYVAFAHTDLYHGARGL